MGILLSILRFFTPSWLDRSIYHGNERERLREKLRQRIKRLERERARQSRVERITDNEERGEELPRSDTDSESDSSLHSFASTDSRRSRHTGRSHKRRDKDSEPESRRERRKDDRRRSRTKSRIFEDSRLNRSENMSRSEKHPDKFDGMKGDLKDWLIHFRACASYNCWSYEEMGLNIAIALKGNAQQVLGDLPYELRENFDAIKDALERRFDPKERKTWRRNELRSRRKGRNETMAEYGFAVSRLTASAYPNLRTEDRETIALEYFIDGLPTMNLKRHVQFNHPETVSQAIAFAIEFESFDDRYANRRPENLELETEMRNVNSTIIEKAEDTYKDDMAELIETNKIILEAITALTEKLKMDKLDRQSEIRPEFRNSERRDIACFICGDPSHLAPACPEKRRSDMNMRDNRLPLNRSGPDSQSSLSRNRRA